VPSLWYRSIERLEPNSGRRITDAAATPELSLSGSPNLALIVWVIVNDEAIKRSRLDALAQAAKPAQRREVEVTTA
jgi:hypothetical protein